ncbi:hypothetical protein GCM10007103_11170 [Salinimicrobium marinum]|uniref:Hydrolase n=1 Tax=Salinimicrobium marinum TaxID=680283 RepID=A0A918VX22_9FLAO|nr:hypothetical protein [Salinimicrobium marinum]GHA31345.1 hypothetical protein GCM10007103_11170 [Salinimicrobium marinum]
MRKSLLLYFSVFMVLVVIFQYVSAKNMVESKDRQIKSLREDIDELKASNNSMASENSSAETFSFSGNEDALTYFEDRGYDPTEVAQLVKDQIIGRNSASEDNDLVPYEGMEGFMRINQIKILNHKWIIANFTDGTYWGEVFMTFELDENKNLILETEKALLYPRNQ